MDQEKKHLTELETLIAAIAPVVSATRGVVQGIKKEPADVFPGVGLYRDIPRSDLVNISAAPATAGVQLVGVALPIHLAVAIMDAFDAAQKTPLIQGTEKKLGGKLGEVRIVRQAQSGQNTPA